MADQKTRQIIRQLKEIRAERSLSYQNICDMVETSGGCVSLASVKRVFADGSEEQNFRYNETIKPIVIALLGINEPPAEDGSQSSEVKALKTVIGIKNQTYDELAAENERVKSDYEKKLAYIKNEAEQKHEHIVELTEQTKELTAQIKRKDRIIFLLSFVLISLLLLAVVALIIDRIDPNLGYFWRTMAAQVGGNGLSSSVQPGAWTGQTLSYCNHLLCG